MVRCANNYHIPPKLCLLGHLAANDILLLFACSSVERDTCTTAGAFCCSTLKAYMGPSSDNGSRESALDRNLPVRLMTDMQLTWRTGMRPTAETPPARLPCKPRA